MPPSEVGHALEDFDVEDGGGGATPMTCPVPGPMAAAAREAVQVPWPFWSCGVPSSQGLGRRSGSMTSVRLRARLGAMSGWVCVDAAVDDGDADAFAHGGVPRAVRGAAGDVVAVAADLLDGPALRGVVVGVVGWGGGNGLE